MRGHAYIKDPHTVPTAMLRFVAPGLLPEDLATFERVFATPITQAQERGATEEQRQLGASRAECVGTHHVLASAYYTSDNHPRELKRRVDGFVLRRTAEVNQRFLPPLTTTVVWCRPSALQVRAYKRLLRSKQIGALLSGSERGMDATLAALMQLRKLCNHPQLVPDLLENEDTVVDADTDAGKFVVLQLLLHKILARGERMVVVSTSTAALDLVDALCTRQGWATVRIDGATEASKRQDIVHAFNNCNVGSVFLLSTRAGGTGLNLIGASRLALLDSDWNPSADAQAMARIWRDGQQRPCTVYRLVLTGTLDEKVYQRQLLKGDLAHALMGATTYAATKAKFTRDELRELFVLHEGTECATRDLLAATGTGAWEVGAHVLLYRAISIMEHIQDERGTLAPDDPLWQAVQDGHVTWLHSNRTQSGQALQQDADEAAQHAQQQHEGAPMGDECLIDCVNTL